jgi:hypothetical protein
MFEVGKAYRFTLWQANRKEGETEAFRTAPYEIREVNLPLIKVWDPVSGMTIINTASITFINASEHVEGDDT